MALYEFDGMQPQLTPSVRFADSAAVASVALPDDKPGIRIIGAGSHSQDWGVLHVDPCCPVRLGTGATVGQHVILRNCTVDSSSLIGSAADCLVGADTLTAPRRKFSCGSWIWSQPTQAARQLHHNKLQQVRQNSPNDNASMRPAAPLTSSGLIRKRQTRV